MLQLFVRAGSAQFDLPSLDPDSLVAASYLQLLKPGEWELVSQDTGSAPTGELPYLKDGHATFSASSILPHLLRSSDHKFSPLQLSQMSAFHSLLDTTVLPLTLHSLFSLPLNWAFFRPLLASSFSYPTKFYRPEQLRHSARFTVDSTHETWWGLGGEAEKEDEDERRRRKVLLEKGTDGWKDRKDEERKEGKERIKKAFGEGKITSAGREVFEALEKTLAASSTPFFFSSSSPTPLDAHLSALLTLILYLPLPQPLLADLINASFPRIWAHTALLRRTLWSEVPLPPIAASPPVSLATTIAEFLPTAASFTPWAWGAAGIKRGNGGQRGSKSPTKKEEEFARKRWWFFGIVAVGVVGWGLGTGALPLPGRLGAIWGREGEEEEGEYEWEEVMEGEDIEGEQ